MVKLWKRLKLIALCRKAKAKGKWMEGILIQKKISKGQQCKKERKKICQNSINQKMPPTLSSLHFWRLHGNQR